MPIIRIGTETLTLLDAAEIALERNSPLLSPAGERGTNSLPFKAARDPNNERILNYPARFDHLAGRPSERFAAELLSDAGTTLLNGSVVLRAIEPSHYVLNLEFGASEVMDRLKAQPLRRLRLGGFRSMIPTNPVAPGTPDEYYLNLNRFMDQTVAAFATRDFTFAPVSNEDCNGKWEAYLKEYEDLQQNNPAMTSEMQPGVTFNNYNDNSFMMQPGFNLSFPFGGMFEVLPRARKFLPLPKLSYVVRELFRELRLVLVTDVFDEPELDQLVLVPANSIERQTDSLANGLNSYRSGFLLAEHLPELNAAQFLRQLMDTLGLHFDVTLAGECRLLRSDRMIRNPEAVDLTTRVSPAYSTQLEAPTSVTARNLVAPDDKWNQVWAIQPEVVHGTVATVAALVTPPPAVDQVFLVSSAKRYYTSVSATDSQNLTSLSWQPGPFYYPEPTVGTADNPEDYQVGHALVSTTPQPFFYGFASFPVDTLTFLEPSTDPNENTYTGPASATLRLAFFRGLQPVPNSATGLIPWLTQGNLSPNGIRLGEYTLEVGGPHGLAAKLLRPLLALRSAHDVVRFPTTLSPLEFNALDFGRPVQIRGDLFMLRRASTTLPQRRAGQLELVPRRSVEHLLNEPAPPPLMKTEGPGVILEELLA